MFEQNTYHKILSDILRRIPSDIDKREGSVIYNAVAPVAAELAQAYLQLDLCLDNVFADTAKGEYLDRRVNEYGVNRKVATHAVRKGYFYGRDDVPIEIPTGTRFAVDGIQFWVESKISTGIYTLRCQQPGTAGNLPSGKFLPLDYIAGLQQAELGEVIIPGADEETDEALYKRYQETVSQTPFGGNKADYIQKVKAIGVGGVKILPVWNGPGTVKLIIQNSEYTTPAQELIEDIQNQIDPKGGDGTGIAPIGHHVTVNGVIQQAISITMFVVLSQGFTCVKVKPEIEEQINVYLKELCTQWETQERLIVRISQIEARVLSSVEGVLDIMNTTINNQSENLQLNSDEIPTFREVTINESN